ncbi:MAG: thiamine pyrophosphate-binding protein [Bacillati bacterium ANGP1]|uniref:Thiamine pyrophosphate-binding protein n=1 Tax=Candidatus Segetimicrobium genomatis TaxID=2569760 RepID=A0A537K4K3_9BACT|nr:MAG: thiamine pyrophosphate-binding protein [Terrabacteria group bacterium ANGP1]
MSGGAVRGGRRPEYGSDLIVDVLGSLGIEYAALNPGATFRGIHDSIVNYGGNTRPELLQCCHEEVAVALAHGYAKAAGKPMAAILHNVVGLQHASMAIFNAWCDRAPMLVMGGTGPMAVEQRRPWIDWIHTALVQGQAVRDFVKWDDQPASLASIPEAIIRGYRIAMTEPKGPVYLCFDAALQEMPLSEDVPVPEVARYAPPAPIAADAAALDEAAGLLRDAERPVIIAEYLGRAPAAVDALVGLAELLAAPVIDLYGHGRFNFPNTHPLDLTGAEKELLAAADVVLALDVVDLYGALARADRLTRRSEPVLPESAKVIHITMADVAIRSWVTAYQRLAPVDVPILADTAAALPVLMARLRTLGVDGEAAGRRPRAERLRARHEALRREARTACEESWNDRPIAPARLASEVWDVLRGEDWVLVNGTLDGWARSLWEWVHPHQYLGNSGGAGLGYGAGASIGAALAHRGTGRVCVDLQPDGDLLYTPSAIWTAAHHRIPVLFVVCNNRTYYNDENHQALVARARGRPVENRVVGIRIEDPPVDFAAMARAFGAYGVGPVEDPEQIAPALGGAMRAVKEGGRPAVVDVVIDR